MTELFIWGASGRNWNDGWAYRSMDRRFWTAHDEANPYQHANCVTDDFGVLVSVPFIFNE